jgi:acyl-CoA synthetase (AMP-forming)/AMP-acid ligase II/alpha-ketoglutarate-dependent taurine dioxygenase/acyl carrier protein
MTSRDLLSECSTLVELCRRRAEASPDGLAYTFLVDGESEEALLTYGGLDRRARAIGAMLQELGARGERVLLLYPPGLEYVSAFMGCLYAGAVAVPAYPPDPMRLGRTLPRLEALVADARARIALTVGMIHAMAGALAEQSPVLGGLRWVATDEVEEAGGAGWRPPEVSRETVAFLQYTSGSTGNPRGVMLSHGNLLHNSAAIHACFEHSAESRGVIWLPPYHDMGLIGGVLQPLCGGFPVVLMSPLDFLRRPVRWVQAISRYRATTSGGPNFAYELCVRKTTPEQRAALDLRSWDLAFNGAEPVRAETLERFAQAFAPAGFRREAFYPCYGLAEATLIVSGGRKAEPPVVRAWDAAALQQGRAVEGGTGGGGGAQAVRTLVGCGASIPGQEVLVLDPESLRPAAEGHLGEICVRGPSVARGYWERPEETERTFVPHLRTGDLGFLSGGELFIAGRLKDLIILRGRNHHPHDLEQTAEASHPALRPGCSAAFAVEAEGEERLVMALEVDARNTAPPQEIMDCVRRAVAAQHEVAVSTVLLIAAGSIPKTSSGKIQRRACRAQYLARELEVVAESTVAPAPEAEGEGRLPREALLARPEEERRGPLEGYLRGRLAHGLGVPESALEGQRPLTALGLDSVRSMELKGALEEELGVHLPPTFLLEGASLEALTARVLEELRTASAAAPPPLQPRGAGAPAPLSHAQERLLFLDQLAPESSAYHVCAAARLEGRLEVAALDGALEDIIRSHEVLRARFPLAGGRRTQDFTPAEEVVGPLARAGAVEHLTHLPEPEREAAARRLAAEEARRPFDLAGGPLLRARLLVLGPERHLLVLTVHHIATDGWSMGVLVRELGERYAARVEGRPAAVPPLPIQYADHAAWLRGWLEGGALEAELAFWRARLAGAPPLLELPLDRPRPASPSFAGARHPLALSEALTSSLKRLGQAEGASPYMVLLAAFLCLLWQRTGRADLVVGTDIANREHAHTQRLIGLFVNQLVMRVSLAGNPPFRELLARVREVALGAYAHPHVPFDKLVEALRPPRDPRYNPLFQIMFVLENAPLPPLRLPGLRLQVVEVDDGGSPFDLSVLLSESEGKLGGALRYSTALFEPATVARLAGDYEAVLARVADRPQSTLEELREVLAGRERQHQQAGARALESARLEKFKSLQARRREVGASSEQWVRFEPLLPGRSLPAVARPAAQGVQLAEWARGHRALVESHLHRHGAILFRGFDVSTAEALEDVVRALADEALPYSERSSPRSQVSGHVYTSTDHPPGERIFLHNEQSYNLTFPLRLFFCCLVPATQGGETPLADSRRVFQRLPPRVRARFLEHGYLYVRNFGSRFGLGWQTAFQTEDPSAVEAYCRENGIELEWRGGHQHLRTRQVRRVAGLHPVTREPVWFNHATFFHVSTLPPGVSAALLAEFGEAELPNNTYYGDGSPIEPEVLERLRAAYEEELVSFSWQAGDVLLLDNMLAAHARAPFVGPRRVLAAMARPFRWEDVETAPP